MEKKEGSEVHNDRQENVEDPLAYGVRSRGLILLFLGYLQHSKRGINSS